MFKIKAESGDARAGILKLRLGDVETPFFMPVGTKAAVKNLSPEMLKETGTKCIIANSFVLSLRPGSKLIKEYGGIHKFMNYNGGIFTDSGGFQAGSESFFVKMTKDGIMFRNPYNGQTKVLTPKKAIKIQEELGGDVAMALDDMPDPTWPREKIKKSIERTHRWAKECIDAKKDEKQLLFGISQGGVHKDLREKSAKEINSLGFDGLAIGGLAIGETKKQMYDALSVTLPHYDKNKVRYLMGLGSPEDIVQAVGMGIDCFDSVYPTKNARQNTFFTFNGKYNFKSAKFGKDFSPLEDGCDCYTCKNFTKAYVYHLKRLQENFGLTLATIHNIRFIHRLFEKMREAIKKDRYTEFKEEFLKNYLKK